MGKTSDHFKKIEIPKEQTLHVKMGTVKDRNSKDLMNRGVGEDF